MQEGRLGYTNYYLSVIIISLDFNIIGFCAMSYLIINKLVKKLKKVVKNRLLKAYRTLMDQRHNAQVEDHFS